MRTTDGGGGGGGRHGHHHHPVRRTIAPSPSQASLRAKDYDVFSQNIYSTCFLPETTLSALQVLTHLIPITTLRGRHSY